jgi:hypothetical protein
MTSYETFIVIGPFLAIVSVMIVGFGFFHYLDNK